MEGTFPDNNSFINAAVLVEIL